MRAVNSRLARSGIADATRQRMRAFIRRHPASCYFALTFAISWGGLIAVAGPTNLVGSAEQFERLFPIALPFLVLGPSIAGIVMTLVTGFRMRLGWRVAPRWWAVLFAAPLYFMVVGLAFAAVSPQFLPAIFTTDDATTLVIKGMAVALVAGIVEELGWTGFAVPTLLRRYRPIVTGLIVGSLWGAWHILPKIWGANAHGVFEYLPVDLAMAVVGLTGFRILMVWVYERTQSLLVGIVMHIGLTGSTLILQPAVTGKSIVMIGVVLSLVPWLVIAIVASTRPQRLRSTMQTDRESHPSMEPRHA